MDIFGAEKFLQVQGYTYYGSLYGPDPEMGDDKNKKEIKKKKEATTCGFIRKEQLYLIPFYDLYHLKKDLEERYRVKCKRLDGVMKGGIRDEIGNDINYAYLAKKLSSQ